MFGIIESMIFLFPTIRICWQFPGGYTNESPKNTLNNRRVSFFIALAIGRFAAQTTMRVAAPPGTPDFYGSMAQTPPEVRQKWWFQEGNGLPKCRKKSAFRNWCVIWPESKFVFCIVSYSSFSCDFFLRSRIYNGELLISYIQHGHLNCTSYDMFLNILKWPNWTYGCSSWQVKLAAYKNEMSPFFLYARVPCMVLALQMLTVD